MQPSNFDYLYAAIAIIVGIIMIANPRTFMRKAKYDEESLKTESLLKKLGIGLTVIGIAFAVYIYLR